MPARSDGIRDRCKLYRNPPSRLGNQGNNRQHGVPPFCARFPAGAGRLFCCAPITHHFFGGNPFTINSGVAPRSRCRRVQPAGVTSAALGASASAVARLQWRAPATNGSERSGQPFEPLGAARTARRLRARAARATAEKLAPERRAAPVRVAGSRGGVIAQRAWGGAKGHRD